MAKLAADQIKKLAAVEALAEINNNFDILTVINNLVYVASLQAPAATDGRVIYISDDLFRYSVSEIYFILNHEFDHIYYRHMDRFAGVLELEQYLVNVATDLIINEQLTREGLKMIPDGITRDKVSAQLGRSIRGRTSEAVYQEIKKEADKLREEFKNAVKDLMQGSGTGDDGEESDEGDDGDEDESNNNKKNSTKQSKPDNGQGQPTVEEILDKLLGKGVGKAYKEKIDKEKQSVEQARQAVAEEQKEELAKARKELGERVVARQGVADKSEREEIDRHYKPPKIDWKKQLIRFLGRHLKRAEYRNWMRPTNRYDDIFGSSNVILPSNRGYKLVPKIYVYLDVSGSMSGIIQNVRDLLAEARKYFKQYSGKYFEFDDEIYEFKRDDFYKQTGTRGGTNIIKVIKHFLQSKDADLCILITDSGDNAGNAALIQALESTGKPVLFVTNEPSIKTNSKQITVLLTDFN